MFIEQSTIEFNACIFNFFEMKNSRLSNSEEWDNAREGEQKDCLIIGSIFR